jgi:hypothetical protein
MTVRSADVARLRTEIEFAEIEAGGHAYALAAPGDRAGRRRERLPHEAHVDFDGIEADLDATSARVAAIALQLRPAVFDRLLMHVDDAASRPLQTVTALQVGGVAQNVTGVDVLVHQASARIEVELHALAVRSGQRVLAELLASGMPANRIRPRSPRLYAPLRRLLADGVVLNPTGPVSDGTAASIAGQAARVAAAPVTQLLDAASRAAATHDGPGVRPEQVARALADAAAALSDRGIADVASQAVNRTAGLGRADGFDDIDLDLDRPGVVEGAPPGGVDGAGQVLIYASELIDRSTCYPCALVDGTEYDTEIAALGDYPFGQYTACLGGPRCRGMLVYVWSPEAPASIGIPR